MEGSPDINDTGPATRAQPDEVPRGAFSVRLPPALYGGLRTRANETGTSMNSLISEAVAALLERADLSRSTEPADIDSRIAADAVRESDQTIGALKGIGKHLLDRGQVALAAVVFGAAARVVAEREDESTASRELSFTAEQAQRHNYLELAASIFEESLRRDPNNLEAVNRLGQLMHHLAQRANDDIDRYRRAEELLSRVTFVDNRAKLFHGWSQLYVARNDSDRYAEEVALRDINEAMRHWAFGQHDGHERQRWMRQLQRLVRLDAKYESAANELIDFAAAQAWRGRPVTHAEVFEG